MRRAVLAVVVVALANLAYAEYNASKHQVFVENLSAVALTAEDLRISCKQLVLQWFTESISGHADFIAHPSGINTTEMTAVITYCQAIEAFHENAAVSTSDRQQVLVPFIGTQVRRP